MRLVNCYCCYCGEPGTTLDHVRPVSYDYTSRKGVRKNKDNCVAACSECNSLLSNYALLTIAERAAHLAERIEERYRSVLATPFWSDDELAELGYTQRTYVLNRQLERQLVLDRIRHANAVSYKTDMSIFDYWDSQNTVD
jgi:hypothetical protein